MSEPGQKANTSWSTEQIKMNVNLIPAFFFIYFFHYTYLNKKRVTAAGISAHTANTRNHTGFKSSHLQSVIKMFIKSTSFLKATITGRQLLQRLTLKMGLFTLIIFVICAVCRADFILQVPPNAGNQFITKLLGGIISH
ncbi:hypothetical protein ATANTOWER_024755 [Ataeniobius toweri]|uniref:Uncharacterized protein n=1 Tax=Ataeniobius toweri TaxID=208326 RepID=A0ABU7BRE5_9TELE|nr:hypothetical protein [Ataeniobius toweri]